MQLNETYQIARLISKYLLGYLTDSEDKQLKDWLKASKNNRILFKEFRQKHFLLNKRTADADRDYESAWREFLERKKNRTSIFKYNHWIFKGVAALFLVSIGLGLYIMLSRPESSSKSTPTATITPGSKHAILTLADGRKIQISDSTQSYLPEMGLPNILPTEQGIQYLEQAVTDPVLTYNQLETPLKGEISLILSDGTQVWMNSESKLKYPVNFIGNERHVMLEGEAYFEVTEDPNRPFIVEMGDASVQVLGTSFNINAYQNEPYIYTTLVDGSIRLRTPTASLDLKPNEQAIINTATLQANKKTVDVRLYTGWQKGRFIFDNQPLEEIMNNISRWYGIHVEFTNPSVKEIPFSGNIERYENLNKIMRMLEKTEDITFKAKGGTLYIGK